jgi:hypothetical protein
VANAMSKVGTYKTNKLLPLVMEDLNYEFEHNDMWSELKDTEKTLVRERAQMEAIAVISSWIARMQK